MKDSDLSKGISGLQIENQKTRKCLKDVFRRGGHPKTLRTSVFLLLSPEIPFAIPHEAKGKGRFNGGDGR